jgi:hypothetical protein
MATLHAYFKPVASPQTADNTPVRGRPSSGAGSHGGASLSIVRDSRSRRVPKRKRIHAADAAAAAHSSEDDSSEAEEPSLPKRHRVNWSSPSHQKALSSAIHMVQQQKVSAKRAAKLNGIPRTVLLRRIHDGVAVDAHVGPKTALSAADETALVSYLLDLADRGFGRDVGDIRRIALQMASTNSKFRATDQWWRGFAQRHPELVRRRTQAFDRLRASAMNPTLIKHYFLLLTSAFAKVQELSGGMTLTSNRIYNMDEIGFLLNAVKPYIVTRRGSKHVFSLSYNSRVTTSLAVCVSAAGFVLPPFFIVKGIRRPSGYLDAAPPHSAFAMAKKGMMTEAVYEQWVEHFVEHMEKRDEKHWCLLLLDGHHSHTMNPKILQRLRDARVYCIALPSHTTSALQLLDVSVFGPLKRAFRRFIDDWKRDHPLQILDRGSMPMIVKQIWRAILPSNITKGAEATGLYPLESNWAAKNAQKFKAAATLHQTSVPSTIAFFNYTQSVRSLGALDLALSPTQSKELWQRIHVVSKLPQLNCVGESMSQARLLNSEERIKRLFDVHDLKMKEASEKQEKRQKRVAAKESKQAERLQKQHAKDQQLSSLSPLLSVMVANGYHDSVSGHPTIKNMRAFAKKHHIPLSESARDKIAARLCSVVQSNLARIWLKADEEEEEEEAAVEEANEEENEEMKSSDEDDDLEDWSDTKIVF